MKYRRMPIEIESPEQVGYGNIRCNLTESSVADMRLSELGLDLHSLVLGYTDHLGRPGLRELIAAEGPGLSAQDVVVTPGAAAALFIVASSLLDAGDRLVVMHPNYATNLETPRAIGCETVTLNLEFERGFRFDWDRLASLVRPGTKLISLTTPHNPTGVTLTEEDLRSVSDLAASAGCRLLVDETYREMNFSGPTPLAASLGRHCISVASMSKSYGLPGIRIGWIITRDESLRETFLAAKEQMFICNSVVDEEIAFEVLSRKEKILTPILSRNRRAFEVLRSWIAAQSELEWVEPSGGVVGFPRIRPDSSADIDAFYRILNEKYRTFVGPGHWFGMDRRFMRIGYAWPGPAELAEGLRGVSLAAAEAKTAD